MNNRGNNTASEYRFNEIKIPSNYGTPMAGEVKVLPNQTQKRLRQWDMETNFSHSAYKQVRVDAVLKHNAAEELLWGEWIQSSTHFNVCTRWNVIFAFALPPL
jgi:hypothetical protein